MLKAFLLQGHYNSDVSLYGQYDHEYIGNLSKMLNSKRLSESKVKLVLEASFSLGKTIFLFTINIKNRFNNDVKKQIFSIL